MHACLGINITRTWHILLVLVTSRLNEKTHHLRKLTNQFLVMLRQLRTAPLSRHHFSNWTAGGGWLWARRLCHGERIKLHLLVPFVVKRSCDLSDKTKQGLLIGKHLCIYIYKILPWKKYIFNFMYFKSTNWILMHHKANFLPCQAVPGEWLLWPPLERVLTYSRHYTGLNVPKI